MYKSTNQMHTIIDDQEEYIISYANILSGLFKHQTNFLDYSDLKKFYNDPKKGVPLCLPKNIKYFDYSNAVYFKINKSEFSKKIFSTTNLKYVGNKKYFRYGNIFASNVVVKKKYYPKLKIYLKKILELKKKIQYLNLKSKSICSMQIRNVPHFGHEAIFKFLIDKFDFLVLNPIFGIKKKNDFSDKVISKSMKFIEKKYKKIKFLPIISNFHYAGPREALHHMNLREGLGFKNFYIGRDHAGAENNFKSLDAIKIVNKFKNNFYIKPVTSLGGYYCKSCKKYLIKGNCGHKILLNISGTELRKALREKKLYSHADKKLQLIINKLL